MKLVLAATVLANACGTTPAFGHAHGGPHHHHDDHHESWADHVHSIGHTTWAEPVQHPDDPLIGDSAFHLHGVWFGIPSSLPSPARPAGIRIDPHPLADILPTPGGTAAAHRPGTAWRPAMGPHGLLGCDSLPLPALHVSDHRLQTSSPPLGVISPCALRVRTVLIRC